MLKPPYWKKKKQTYKNHNQKFLWFPLKIPLHHQALTIKNVT